MDVLEAKIQILEQQLSRLYQHLGTPNGTLFAPYEKVAALETIVQKQQVKLDLLEQTQVLFLQSVPQYLEQQVQHALQQRGSKGADFVAITQFVTGHLANAIVKLQEACFKTVHESLPLQAVQALEKKLQTSLQTQQTQQTQPGTLIQSTVDSLHNRISMLEIQRQDPIQIQKVQQDSNQLQEHRQEHRQQHGQEHRQEHGQEHRQEHGQNNEELATLKEHMEHLETKLLAEVQRAYTTVHKPGEYGRPLANVQVMIETLNKEFQSFRQVDVRKIAETMITTAHQNLRKEFTDFLNTCITKKEYRQFEDGIHRVEEYTKDIRGGFYKLKNEYDTVQIKLNQDYEEFQKRIEEQYSDERLIVLTKTIQKNIENKLNNYIKLQEYYISTIKSIKESYILKDTYTNEMMRIREGMKQITTLFKLTIYKTKFTNISESLEVKETLNQLNTIFNKTSQKINKENLFTQLRKTQLQETKPVEVPLLMSPNVVSTTYTNTSSTNIQYQSTTKCFYTAIFGIQDQTVDTLGDVERIPGWDYLCFTNQPLKQINGWTIIQVPYTGLKPALEAKRYKWLSHEVLLDYDVVVWLDAYITPKLEMRHILKQWILNMKEKQIPIFHRPHETRNCIWDECDAVVKSKRDNAENVSKVRKLLETHNMPKGWGLFDTNILVRFHKHKIVQTLSEEIYKQLSTTSIRDQLAVTFVYYKYGYKNFYSEDLFKAFQKNGSHIRIDA